MGGFKLRGQQFGVKGTLVKGVMHRYPLGMNRIALFIGILVSWSSFSAEEPIGKFRNTYYYMVFESDFPREAKTSAIRTLDGAVLARVTKKFYDALWVEGSARLRDGRTVNWAGVVDGEKRYHVTRFPWGRGTGNCPLVPFRTIAADPTQIPAGAVVRIAETVGMKLPDGSRSDGIWRAEDTGSAILHDRIDIYIGKKSYAHFLSEAGISHLQALTISLVNQPLPDSCVYKNPE
jgi:3D (Asp-Asp-Asp) domain-containing protein